ncbi:MAG: hypothetical protein IT292_08635 [Deltaproteobacteria bacterium]|nr:hypothetical protein [Deltaproteobacteria bacterium]
MSASLPKMDRVPQAFAKLFSPVAAPPRVLQNCITMPPFYDLFIRFSSLVRPGGFGTSYWSERKVDRSKFMSPEEMAEVLKFVIDFPGQSNVGKPSRDNFH